MSGGKFVEKWPWWAAVVLGGLTVLSFAPFRVWVLMPLSLAVVVRGCWSVSPRRAFALMYVWALSSFSANFYWIFHSLHDVAGLPVVLAVPLVGLLPAVLAIFPASAMALTRYLSGVHAARSVWIFPAAWGVLEWVRGWAFTGFSWGGLAYSQTPESPLAGWLPVLGVYGVGAWVALTASVAAWLMTASDVRRVDKAWVVGLVAVLWTVGAGLKSVEWTHAEGQPIRVALLQGNIPQSLKWDASMFETTLARYAEQMTATRAELIILPETAMPVFWEDLPADFVADVRDMLQRHGQVAVTGVPLREGERYFNGVVAWHDAAVQYRKAHLVPFGEYIPLPALTGWLYRFMNMPLSGFSRGASTQEPLPLLNQRIAFNVCYEDSFGEELLFAARSATMLANVSNLAWFGDSTATALHLQMSQARALETGRPVLRATNTGVTAVIDAQGRVVKALPQMQAAILEADVTGYMGMTPYMRYGNGPVVWVMILVLVVARQSLRYAQCVAKTQ